MATSSTSTVAARVVTVAAGNCFQLAAQYLGDATQVDRILRLNPALNGDPWFTGGATILIPAPRAGAGNGGIING